MFSPAATARWITSKLANAVVAIPVTGVVRPAGLERVAIGRFAPRHAEVLPDAFDDVAGGQRGPPVRDRRRAPAQRTSRHDRLQPLRADLHAGILGQRAADENQRLVEACGHRVTRVLGGFPLADLAGNDGVDLGRTASVSGSARVPGSTPIGPHAHPRIANDAHAAARVELAVDVVNERVERDDGDRDRQRIAARAVLRPPERIDQPLANGFGVRSRQWSLNRQTTRLFA